MNLLKPKQRVKSIYDINFDELKKNSIDTLLLDIDDTLIPRELNDVPPRLFEWIMELKEIGFKICLTSNSRHPLRVKYIGETLQIPYISLGFKPVPFAFWRALSLLHSKPQNTAMIGDQLFMDILGANLLKIHSILVDPITPETFFIRQWMRIAENWALKKIYPL